MKYGRKNLKKGIEDQLGNFKEDHVTELIKMLHCVPDTDIYYNLRKEDRERIAFGTTKQEAAERFGVDEKTIRNMFAQLDPNRRPANTEPYYIAGQPIDLEIREKRINNRTMKENAMGWNEEYCSDRRVRYCSASSMHPVFFQLNVTQLGALLRALAVDYKKHESKVTLGLGAYLYAQLSDYAKDRLIEHFAIQDPDIADFLETLDDMEPSDFIQGFQTESEMAMVEHDTVSIDDLVLYCKNGWVCDITIRLGEGRKTLHNVKIENDGDFFVKTANGLPMIIHEDDIIELKRV